MMTSLQRFAAAMSGRIRLKINLAYPWLESVTNE